MKNFVGEDTIILSLMNGITSEELIGAEYGMEKMLYAVSFALTPTAKATASTSPIMATWPSATESMTPIPIRSKPSRIFSTGREFLTAYLKI